MPLANVGVPTAQQYTNIITNEVFSIGLNWFAPRCPLLSRMPHIPDSETVFQMVNRKYRPRKYTLGAAVADGVVTTITLTDASPIMTGDVLKLASGEFVEVLSMPNTSTNVVTVQRGVSGTTAAAQSNGTAVVLVTNSRTGGEDSPEAISPIRSSTTQYMQTVEHPYKIGGSLNATSTYPLDPRAATPLDEFRMDALQHAMDDMEYAAYLGKADAGSTTGRPKMNGLRETLVTNRVTAPSDAGAYKALSFQRDLLTTPRKNGAQPDVVFVASNWMDAFSTWGQPLVRYSSGETAFGISLNVYKAPFLGDVTVVEASLLPDFTAFSLTSRQVKWRIKRPLIDEQFGKTGDNTKGHIVGEGAIEIDDEFHHAWLEGVTSFSA